MKRESFQSRLGFLLVTAGCAIGIGNVWRFPFVAGQNGGGIFVILYLIFLLCMGVPVLTMELAVGRASRKSAVLGYKALEKPGSKWHIHGWFCIFGCYMLMMYYTTVSGWMLSYFFRFVTGTFHLGMDATAVGGVFSDLLASPKEMGSWMAVTVVLGFLVCSMGLQKGVEKISKYMMSALLLLIIVLVIHSLALSGGAEGIRFYLIPDLQRASDVGIGSVVSAAMNQSFFTLSLGIAAMEIFGSYIEQESHAGRRSYPDLCAGYLCRDHVRSDHFSGLLFFRNSAGCRSVPHFCDAAERLYQHGRRTYLGCIVLSVYDICELQHRHSSI